MALSKSRIKRGDDVIVISGKHKGSTGEVIAVDLGNKRVLIKNVNVIKKAQRPTQENPRGGFVEQESPIHLSNVQLVDPKTGERTRVGYRVKEDGTKVRVALKSGTELDD